MSGARSLVGPAPTDPAPSREFVEAWGMAWGSDARVLRPRSVAGVQAAFLRARETGARVVLRGTGNSYGDASCARPRGGEPAPLVLDCRAMDRILGFDPATGVVECEPGVTVEALWRKILPYGYWPRVVSGTMRPTLAGAAAMNIHGKNAYKVGTLGEAIRELDLVLPSGERVTASRKENARIYHAVPGSFGVLGVITRLVLETTRVHSGDLEVHAFAAHDLGEMMGWIEARRASMDYLVGWIDCFPGGDCVGRGLVHGARYLAPGEDPDPARTLDARHQDLPKNVLGVLPKAEVWRLLRLFNHDPGMRLVNAAKVLAGRLEGMRGPHRQAHAAFAFLLDYVPNWKWAYGRRPGHGLIQHQLFVPAEHARAVFTEAIERSRRAGHVSYLGVLKRHRPDPFLLTHGLDGWSLALDFKVTPSNRASLWRHAADLTALVLEAGGNFYFAKDLALDAASARRMFGEERLECFLALKRELDPDGRLASDLWLRLFAPDQSPMRA